MATQRASVTRKLRASELVLFTDSELDEYLVQNNRIISVEDPDQLPQFFIERLRDRTQSKKQAKRPIECAYGAVTTTGLTCVVFFTYTTISETETIAKQVASGLQTTFLVAFILLNKTGFQTAAARVTGPVEGGSTWLVAMVMLEDPFNRGDYDSEKTRLAVPSIPCQIQPERIAQDEIQDKEISRYHVNTQELSVLVDRPLYPSIPPSPSTIPRPYS